MSMFIFFLDFSSRWVSLIKYHPSQFWAFIVFPLRAFGNTIATSTARAWWVATNYFCCIIPVIYIPRHWDWLTFILSCSQCYLRKRVKRSFTPCCWKWRAFLSWIWESFTRNIVKSGSDVENMNLIRDKWAKGILLVVWVKKRSLSSRPTSKSTKKLMIIQVISSMLIFWVSPNIHALIC